MATKESNGFHAQETEVPEEEGGPAPLPDRGTWTGKFDFILACLGTAVGLGNVWRFPYLCYRNGGAAFVIPYVIMVFVIGLPVFLLELGLGQFSALGPHQVFVNLAPLFKGMGYAMLAAATLVAIYYNMIIAWTLFYFFDSFRSDVQWQYCKHDFNTDNCFSDVEFRKCKADNESNVFNFRQCFNSTYAGLMGYADLGQELRISSSEEYLNRYMLGKSAGFHDMGGIRWQLALCLLCAWIIVVGCLIKGIKSSGKVVYFTATFPYVILVILFIRGITLDGALLGLKFYVIPDWAKLQDVKVWQDAAIQVFYSFSIGGGGMMTYASYNKFSNNLVKDAWIIGMGDMLTSLFSGVVVFSMVGFMATQLGKPVEEVVQSGTGLAFIAYPDGISRMPLSPLWALLFFFMLFLLGIDSQFAVTETLITFIFDQFPKTRSRKALVVTSVGSVLFLLGLPLTTNGGIYLLEIMDNYGAGWPYLIIGLLECIIVSYVYGIENFLRDVKQMTGWTPGSWTKHHLIVTVMTISPALMAFLLLLSWIQYEPLKMGAYVFPTWGNAIGWGMALIPVSLIPIMMIVMLFTKHTGLGFRKRVQLLLRPTDVWYANARRQTSLMKCSAVVTKTESGAYDNLAMSHSIPDFNSRL